jgi:4-amino-4-deoxychorismate lyase
VKKWLVNGMPATSIDVADRGLHYGDGLFETVALREGRPRFLESHAERLSRGLHRLGISAAGVDAAMLEVEQLARSHTFGVAKIIITRGGGPRGYRPPAEEEPTRIVGADDAKPSPAEYYAQGIALRYCETQVSANAATAGLKTLNRIEQVLARAEWDDPSIVEGLMLNDRTEIVSGTMSNVFRISGSDLHTPPLVKSGIAGIMRAKVLEVAPSANLRVSEATIRPEELRQTDELFVTNSQIGIWPVRRIGELKTAVGPRTRELMQCLVALGVKECAR